MKGFGSSSSLIGGVNTALIDGFVEQGRLIQEPARELHWLGVTSMILKKTCGNLGDRSTVLLILQTHPQSTLKIAYLPLIFYLSSILRTRQALRSG